MCQYPNNSRMVTSGRASSAIFRKNYILDDYIRNPQISRRYGGWPYGLDLTQAVGPYPTDLIHGYCYASWSRWSLLKTASHTKPPRKLMYFVWLNRRRNRPGHRAWRSSEGKGQLSRELSYAWTPIGIEAWSKRIKRRGGKGKRIKE